VLQITFVGLFVRRRCAADFFYRSLILHQEASNKRVMQNGCESRVSSQHQFIDNLVPLE
jgi:hypothetical protein